MEKIQILWVDDEIDHLKSHLMFLDQKGYAVDTVTNGDDALDMIAGKRYDIVFLDENMPGMTGLETLSGIKERRPNLSVVMITKSEEEHIMEDAIGSQISDYLIKPVNPNQILLTIKKTLESKRLVSEKTTSNYQQEFRQIGMELSGVRDWEEWISMYKRLIYWELELENLDDEGMEEILATQKKEANSLFFRYVEENYTSWLQNGEGAPHLSHNILPDRLFPKLKDSSKPVFLFVIDNLRYDQFRIIQPILEELFTPGEEESFFSILPTATQYSRNAMFAGLMPLDIQKHFPDKWVGDNEDEGKNQHEEFLLRANLKRHGLGDQRISYHKVTNLNAGKKLAENLSNLMQNDLNVIVYNFVDMLSHAKTDMRVIKELADNDRAYRSLTLSWFRNSPLLDILRQLAASQAEVVITTDHGTINVKNPSKLVGDRNVNTNLRYKTGKNMSYNRKEVLEISEPERAFLPRTNVTSAYVFAREDLFFAYPNNYHYYVNYYRNTYQHGGVSLEEMIIPFASYHSK